MSVQRINIVAWNNGGGLIRDVETLAAALPGDRFELFLNGGPLGNSTFHRQRFVHRATNLGRAVIRRRELKSLSFDVNIFLEDISPEFFGLARANTFIPNPEWCRRYMLQFLRGIDLVMCKTAHAVDIFGRRGNRTHLVGFTSEDRSDPDFDGDKTAGMLHIAGRSWQKGTGQLIQLWQRHPRWPTLTVVQNPNTYRQSQVRAVEAPNINHVLERLEDSRLRDLQNSHRFHLCPTEVEGFGHCIVEAMSCAAVTLTTDAPPMNELISPDRGVLVQYGGTRKQNMGTRYYVDPTDLERKIESMMSLDAGSCAAIGKRARQWYEANDQRFRRELVRALTSL